MIYLLVTQRLEALPTVVISLLGRHHLSKALHLFQELDQLLMSTHFMRFVTQMVPIHNLVKSQVLIHTEESVNLRRMLFP
ncbi:hypothetical protein DKG82_22805 [Salmonella enterica subsp. enterica serovar Lexington]|nr:hypothetical protein [Salmonella enterica subsp. enterica serovar Lexington]EBH8913044.1 hypothetical protein [Salmonella enterica subsp. enterica serovar Teko]MIG58802.1 hypothetical protein [Salmonella enterica subsp. houtenae]EAA7875455.1 hypothetical protein [Salmonella enterica subsp. enterica serovar Lexington]EBH8474378.1 hypothetical protein [Salmonella enterica subsp. enterica serovar Lexington]